MNKFEAINQELQQAAEQLNDAYVRYQAVILARIAIVAEIREGNFDWESEWHGTDA